MITNLDTSKRTIARYGYVWNGHIMFIYIYIYIHRTLESRNTKNTYDFLVQVRNFLLPLSLKVLRHKERDTHSFFSAFFICIPPSRATPAQGLREQAKVNRLLPRQDSTLITDFWKFPKILRALPVHDVIHTASPVSHLGLLWHLWVTRPLRSCVNTCVNVAPK